MGLQKHRRQHKHRDGCVVYVLFVELNQYQIDTLTALSTNPAVKLTKEQKDLIAKLSINRGAATYKDRIDLGNLIGSIKKIFSVQAVLYQKM